MSDPRLVSTIYGPLTVDVSSGDGVGSEVWSFVGVRVSGTQDRGIVVDYYCLSIPERGSGNMDRHTSSGDHPNYYYGPKDHTGLVVNSSKSIKRIPS